MSDDVHHPDLNFVDTGISRSVIEEELGKPFRIEGTKHVYAYRSGQGRSLSKAAGSALMNISTLGLWEVSHMLGAHDQSNYHIFVEYDQNHIASTVTKKRLDEY